MKKALTLGVTASLFFSLTFILNKTMNLSGGNWMWSSSLRFILMLPLLSLIVIKNGRFKLLLKSINKHKTSWLIWSTVGFGLFYAPLTFASNYGESWLVAGCWQITIIFGILLTPIFKNKLPIKNLIFSFIILIGIFMIQYENSTKLNFGQVFLSIFPISIAAISYPLGNRKMMQICSDDLSSTERVLGMTICSLPFWILMSLFAYKDVGLPSSMQVFQSFSVAIFSGIIATILFFKATTIVKDDPKKLAVIEATQSGEVIFTLILEIIFLSSTLPGIIGFIGLILIIFGMVINSIIK
ncbi:multidrug resistance efflux transporter family protein [Clostridium chrysemydis]|uniref:DMT family transporter n=1 Tax=Clostridium chrysemydis TaxID=2665504 RepID=UPI0018837B22|nr:multidrug resistance efflux transporter family protein [Clostridium chrysemydis]